MKIKTIAILVITSITVITSYACCGKEITNNRTDLKCKDYLIECFENHIIHQFPSSSIYESYEVFFETMSKASSTQEMREILSISDTKQREVFRKIGRNKLSEVWVLNRDDSLRIESINLDGAFLKLLKEVSMKNSILKDYYDSIKMMGDISPRCIDIVKSHSGEFQINDMDIKLILAVHYFSINQNPILKK